MSARVPEPSPSQQVTLLVADDADVIRRTLRNFLKGEPAIKVLGEASNFAETTSMNAITKATKRLGFLLKTMVPLECWTRQSCATNDELIPAILQTEN
jgi:hypothetical protein